MSSDADLVVALDPETAEQRTDKTGCLHWHSSGSLFSVQNKQHSMHTPNLPGKGTVTSVFGVREKKKKKKSLKRHFSGLQTSRSMLEPDM